MDSTSQLRDPRTYTIIAAAMTVHRELGHGFLEPVYQEALAVELASCGIPHTREVSLPIHFKSVRLQKRYRADFLCYDGILVEIKALPRLTSSDEAQVINYLKASGLGIALLFNFGTLNLQYRRLVFTHPASASSLAVSV